MIATVSSHNGAASQPGALWRKRLVLIIDDDEATGDVYAGWFFMSEFQTMCAAGTEGVALALQRGEPSLIVAGVCARDLTVNEPLKRLRADERTRSVPVLVATSAADQIEVENRTASPWFRRVPMSSTFNRVSIA